MNVREQGTELLYAKLGGVEFPEGEPYKASRCADYQIGELQQRVRVGDAKVQAWLKPESRKWPTKVALLTIACVRQAFRPGAYVLSNKGLGSA